MGAFAGEYMRPSEGHSFDLHARGQIPEPFSGSLIVPSSRRHKDRRRFSRWHDSQSDLLRLDLSPGRPGRVRVHVLEVDPSAVNLGHGFDPSDYEIDAFGRSPAYGYATQPNHGVNTESDTVWATNLLFGAPLEVDLESWKPRRILRYVGVSARAPRVTGTSHFAWSLDHRFAYFHQSLLVEERGAVRAEGLLLIEFDVRTGNERTWEIVPPVDDPSLDVANFHSGFAFEEDGRRYVGLLRTGALLESLIPHSLPVDHSVLPMPPSTIWILEVDAARRSLQAELLPGIGELDGLALSHLDVDASTGDGFVLYANFKEADVAEETHGPNVYGEPPDSIAEHYAGMTVEALNHGLVMRYERRAGRTSLRTFSRPYDPGNTSLGHTWLPINLVLDPTRKRLFCTFSGFRPRLASRHIAKAYSKRVVDPVAVKHVPPLLLRLDASTLRPDIDGKRGHLSYGDPIAIDVVGDGETDYVCTFSPEAGLRIYPADDLGRMIFHAESPKLMHWKDDHFRPEPPHLQFVGR